MEIHEKYKTPTHYKNFISTIVLTNENALRVENDDRHTVFLDVSPSRKEDLGYFKKLGDAMKCPGASEAFYAYLRAIVDTYPDFNGNPPPMTASKQDHIISTLPPLFQFIKDTYLAVKNHITDLPVQEFYRVYTSYCETHCISPLSKINASRILSNKLGIKSKKIRIGEDLYDIEGIDTDTPKKPASDPKALEKFLAKIYNPANNPQDVQEKPAKEKPSPVIEAPPPVPPKPDCLKVKPAPVINEDPIPEEPPAPIESGTDEIIDSFSDCYLSDEEPDQENEPSAEEPALEADDDYNVLDDLLSDSDPITTNPANEQQPEPPAFVTKSDPELALKEQPIPEPDTEPEIDWDPEPKEGTSAYWAWQERRQWNRKPWVKNSKDQTFNNLYNTGKELWAKYQDTSDKYNWDHFKDWIEYNGDLPKASSHKELANIIRAYKEDHDAEIIPTPSGYETMKMDRKDKGKA
ncbi:hypothetical protein RhiirB3_450204 [Rhizophagus irregularis]|nr:hypothetical protein RhiirB3_450204 [Rhizophagus irregularis]